jgi:uncharacterized membrane protein
MTDLFVIGFDQTAKADQAMSYVQQMADDGLLDVESVAVVVRDQNGKASYRTTSAVPGPGQGAVVGGLWGALWGMFIGAMFAPVTAGASLAAGMAAGTAVGAAGGAVTGEISKADFDDDFTIRAEALLRPGTSALVALIDAYLTISDELLRRLRPLNGTVLKTNLTPEAEGKLRKALAPAA